MIFVLVTTLPYDSDTCHRHLDEVFHPPHRQDDIRPAHRSTEAKSILLFAESRKWIWRTHPPTPHAPTHVCVFLIITPAAHYLRTVVCITRTHPATCQVDAASFPTFSIQFLTHAGVGRREFCFLAPVDS